MHIATITTRRPIATTMFFLAIILIGIVSVWRLPVELLPDISFPKLIVWTTWRDAGPVEVEEFVTRKVEETLATLPGVRRIKSISRSGSSMVVLEMLWGTDMDFLSLTLREKLDNLTHGVLPERVDKPVILRTNPGARPVMTLVVTGDGALQDYFTLARDVFRRRFEQIDGVALASVTGGRKREIHVEIDMTKAQTLGISIAQIEKALQQANDNRSGGSIRKGRYRYALRTVGEFRSLDDIAATVVFIGKKNGKQIPVHLRELAKITDSFQEAKGETRFNGKPAIGLLIFRESGANTIEVAGQMSAAIDQLQRQYPKAKIMVVDNQAEFISESVDQVKQALIYGGILAFLVLFFFLHDIRNPLNIAISMPVSIIATFTLMYFANISLNMISLGGLALCIGMLVDNSIVVLENIFRRRDYGQEFFEAAVAGTREVTMPIIASTFTTIAVFFPILYIEGVAGQLFRDQSLTVSFSLLCSLIVALTLLPMIAAQWRDRQQKELVAPRFPGWRLKRNTIAALLLFFPRWCSFFLRGLLRFWTENFKNYYAKLCLPAFAWIDRLYLRFSNRYEKILQTALDFPRRTFGLTIVVFFLALAASTLIDRRLMPEVEQGEFIIEISLPPGTRLEITRKLSRQIEKIALADPAVSRVFSRVGQVENEMYTLQKQQGTHYAELTVFLDPGAKTRTVAARMQQKLDKIDARAISLKAAATTISEVLGANNADLSVEIRGNDIVKVNHVLEQTQQKIMQIDGVRQCVADVAEKQPEMHLQIDRRKAALAGVEISAIAGHIRNFIHGAIPTDFKAFDRKIPILVRADAGSRADINALLRSQIQLARRSVPVSEFVAVQQTLTPAAILRENQVRQQTLSITVGDRNQFAVSREIAAMISQLDLPEDVQVQLGARHAEMLRSFRELAFAFLLAFILVFMILAAQFESVKLPFIIIFSIPLALIGVVVGLLLTGQSFNGRSLIGIVVLVGIVVNDAIVKVDFIRQEQQQGSKLRPAILAAGQKRLRPIIMTTVTTVLGLLPMALGFGTGAELRQPLAIAIIFGLSFATALILVVVPVLYLVVQKEGKN